MKLFNRGKEEASSPAAAAPLQPAPGAAPAEPAAPPGPDLSTVLDASVKEMSEKIARLTSSLESVSGERASMEDKLSRMEDRMRKLSSLTEMISAPYNPFVGDVPPARESLVPQAQPAAPSAAAGAVVALEPLPGDKAAAAVVPLALADDDEPEFGLEPEPDPAPAAALYPTATLAPAAAAADEDDDDAPPLGEPVPAAAALATPGRAQLERVEPGFQNSLLLLNWADMLLRTARSRQGVNDLVDYYVAIGWISEAVGGQLLTYANGIALDASASAPAVEWRGNAEVHERSLLYVEKLRLGART